MKRSLVLSIALLVTTTFACKNKQNTTTTEPAVVAAPAASATEAQAVANEIKVPAFADAEVTKFCGTFKDLMNEYASLKGTGDQAKEAALETKFNQWAEQGATLAGKIKPEEMQSFNDFIMSAQKQFMEMKTAASH